MQPKPASRLRALLGPEEEPRPASRLRALLEGAWEPDPADPKRERRALPEGGFEYRAKAGDPGRLTKEPEKAALLSSPGLSSNAPPPADPRAALIAAKRGEVERIRAGGDVNKAPVEAPSTWERVKRSANLARGGMTEGADFLANLPETVARAVTEPVRKLATELAPPLGVQGVQGLAAQRFALEDPAQREELAHRVAQKREAEAVPPAPQGLSMYGAPEIVDETLQNAREEREHLTEEMLQDVATNSGPVDAALMATYGPRFTGNLLDPTMLFGPLKGAAGLERAGVAAAEAVERPAVRLRTLLGEAEEVAPTLRPREIPPDIAELAAKSLEIGPAPERAPRGRVSVAEILDLDPPEAPVRTLTAVSPTGDEVGHLRYQKDPAGGFRVEWVETDARGSGVARQLYREASKLEGPYRGSSLARTPEGEALVSRLRETDPDIFPAAGHPAPAEGIPGAPGLRPREAGPVAAPAFVDLRGAGQAISDNLYSSVWDRLKAGKRASPFATNPPAEKAVEQAFRRGEVQSAEDVKRIMQGVGSERPPLPAPTPRGVAVTERGTRIGFDYEVREASDLITSHDEALRPNPGYPQDLQPRDRSRLASEAQVGRIERQLNPELLGESPHASNGAPILGPDGIVESGNARSIALKRAYRGGTDGAAGYRAWLETNAQRFGLDPADIAARREPVLVRVRNTDVDRISFAAEANEAPQAAMSATERAAADARRITPEMIDSLRIPESGEVNFQAHRDFVRAFTQSVSPNDLGTMFDARGLLSAEGQGRIRNAILAKAYGDPAAIAQLIEHADSNVRNIGAALLREAPRYARLREGVAAGALHQLDITDDIGAALRKLSALREEGTRVPDYLAQGGLFGSELTPEARVLLATFDANARSAAKVSGILRRYADLAEGAGHPQQAGLFGPAAPPSPMELLREAVADEQGSLFSMAGAPPSTLAAEQAAPPPAPSPAAVDRGLFAGLDEPPVRETPPPVHETPAVRRPPVEPPPALPGMEEGPTTSLKNAVTLEERTARGLPEVEVTARRTLGEDWDRAKLAIQDDPDYPRRLAEMRAKEPRTLSSEENAVLLHDRMRLTLEHREALAAEETALKAGDADAVAQARIRRASLETAINTNDEAARRAGYEWGIAGRARQMLIREDFSPARLIQRAKVAVGGEALPPKVADRLAKLSSGVEEATAQLGAHEEQAAARAAERALVTLQRDAAAAARRTGRAASREALGAEFDALSKEFGRKATTPRMGLDPDLVVLIGKMARNRVQAGVVELEALVDTVYQAVRPHVEGISPRDVRDAISGYGRTSQPTKDEIAAQLREIKAQGRLVSALEDAETGARPLKTGYQRGPDSGRVRELRQQVNEAMRVHGLGADVSPERQMRNGLDAAKTRLRRQIDDINRRIETGARPTPKTPIQYDAEALALREERDRLKAVLEQMEAPGLADEQRLRIAERATERRIQDLQAKIASGDVEPRGRAAKPPVTSPRLDALKQEQAGLAQQLREMRAAAGVPERARLKALKARLMKQEDELRGRLESGDFSPKAKPAVVVEDAEATALRARVNGLKREANDTIRRLELAGRGRWEKGLDWTVGWSRMMKLSGLGTLQKIGAAASERVFIFQPLEEVIGAGLSKLPGIKTVAARAPIEGGGSTSAIAKSFAEFFSKATREEILGHLKLKEGALDLAYGKEHAAAGAAPKWMEFFGHIHAGLKSPAKRAGFKYALEKQAEFYASRGADLLDPVLQAEINARAYEYAQRQIFMGDNALVKAWRKGVGELRGRGHKTAAAGLDIAFPIVKVPTNYVYEASDYALGLPKGVAGLVKVLRAGVDSVKPAEAEQIMRQLKKGTFGAGLIALGAAGFEQIQGGGFYRQGEHRRKSDLQAGDLKLFGITIPHLLAHHPAVEMLQVGAQMRRVEEQYHGRAGATAEGIRSSVAGVASQVPFFDEPVEMGRSLQEKGGPTKYAGQLVRGATIPPDIQRLARLLDERGQHDRADALLKMLGLRHIEARKRRPDDLLEEEMMGIPGLRDNVR